VPWAVTRPALEYDTRRVTPYFYWPDVPVLISTQKIKDPFHQQSQRQILSPSKNHSYNPLAAGEPAPGVRHQARKKGSFFAGRNGIRTQGRETFSLTTTSAVLQQTFWVPGTLRPQVLPAPAQDGWSPPAFPSRPARTDPRPTPASHSSFLPTAPTCQSPGEGTGFAHRSCGHKSKQDGGKSCRIPHNSLPGKPREHVTLFLIRGECK